MLITNQHKQRYDIQISWGHYTCMLPVGKIVTRESRLGGWTSVQGRVRWGQWGDKARDHLATCLLMGYMSWSAGQLTEHTVTNLSLSHTHPTQTHTLSHTITTTCPDQQVNLLKYRNIPALSPTHTPLRHILFLTLSQIHW